MNDLERRALLGDAEAQRECTEKGIVLPCPFCGWKGKVSFKDHRFCGQNYRGSKRIVYRIQVICNKCRSRGKPIFTQPIVNPNPYITKWGNNYAETESCRKETERFTPYVVAAVSAWNTRPAPPIGRCKDCEHYTLLGHCKIHSQEPDEYGPGAYVEMLPDDFCSYFEPRRPMQPNTNQTITDLQREIRDRRELGQPTAAVVKSLQEMEKEAGHDK